MDLTSVLMAKALSGGGGMFVVTVNTVEESWEEGGIYYTSFTATSDKTLEEIYNAWTAGQMPVVKITGDAADFGDAPNVLYLDYIAEDDEAFFHGARMMISPDSDGVVSGFATSSVNISGDDPEYRYGEYWFPQG